MFRPSAAALMAGLLSIPLLAAAQDCTRENVQAAERTCNDVHRSGRMRYMCFEALGLMHEKCQSEHRRRGETYPPRTPAEHPTRLLRTVRNRYLSLPAAAERAADSDGIPREGSADYVHPSELALREHPLSDDEAVPVARDVPEPLDSRGVQSLALEQARVSLTVPNRATSELAQFLARNGPPPLFVVPPSAMGSAALLRDDETRARATPPGVQTPAGLQVQSNSLVSAGMMSATGLGSLSVGLLERVQTRYPRSAEVALVAGLAYQHSRQPAMAAAALTRAVELQPDFAPAYQHRAAARLAYGDVSGARADAEATLKLDPENAQAKRMLGQARELAEGAARVGAMNVGFGPGGDAPDMDGAGSVTAGKDGPSAPRVSELSGEALERAAAASIVLPAGGKGLAQAPAATRRWLEGLAPEPAAFAALPATTRGLWLSALENAAIGRWKPALEDSTLLTQAAPDEKGPWLLRSKVLGRLVNWKAAESDARRALEKAPEDPAALLELGYAQLQQGRAEEGLATIDRALALAPNSGLGQLYRAEALEKLGRTQEAVSAYRLAASLDPVLRPLTEGALARLEPRGAEPERPSRRVPPWRKTLLAVAALVGVLLALKAAHSFGVFGGGTRHEAAQTALAARGSPVAEHRPGDVIGGHFTVEKELARGGMGVVYLATDTMLKRSVAIKRLNQQAYESDDARRKFIQEAQLAARLKHANLAQIHSVFGERELYLVFEYVEGKSLDAALAERGRLGLRETQEIVRQVCAGLAHAHEGRVIHRDLKPANVMLGADGTAKILDFGIAHEARTVSNATLTQAWGTPPYMAPEQEDGYVSPASDLYALGVMAYELLTGQRPFEGANQLGLKRSGSFAKLGGRHGLPPETDRFFARALHPDPAQRFARASDFENAFDELAGTPVRS